MPSAGHPVGSNESTRRIIPPPALGYITRATLVLHGDRDVFNPVANAHLLVERIPDARLELLPGARHAYFEECRETAGRLVREFLT